MIPEVGKIYKNIWNEYAQVIKVKFDGVQDKIELMMLGGGYQTYQRYETLYENDFQVYYKMEIQ